MVSHQRPQGGGANGANVQQQTPLIPRAPGRRITRGLILAFVLLSLFFVYRDGFGDSRFKYKYVVEPAYRERYAVPLSEAIRLPRNRGAKIPRIQHDFRSETKTAKKIRVARLDEIRDTFRHAWDGYKREAWAQDELRPLTGGYKTPFCGWAATMVDTLDTLLIMGLYGEFALALEELKTVDFTHKQGCQINLFETTIRHLGGMLAAYDLSGGKHKILVEKAVELAEVLFTAFDTENRMPSPHYTWSW